MPFATEHDYANYLARLAAVPKYFDAHVALMTWSKVTGRITGDAGDDIVFFFDGFAARAARPEPGSNVLFL